MTIRRLIQVARRRGVKFERRGDRLAVIGLHRLSKKQQTAVRAARSGILAQLPDTRGPQEPLTLSDAERIALGFTKIGNGEWSHNSGDEAGAAILALDRKTLQPLIDEGKRQLDRDMVEAGLRPPRIEKIKLTPVRPGLSKFVLERGVVYRPLPHELQ